MRLEPRETRNRACNKTTGKFQCKLAITTEHREGEEVRSQAGVQPQDQRGRQAGVGGQHPLYSLRDLGQVVIQPLRSTVIPSWS